MSFRAGYMWNLAPIQSAIPQSRYPRQSLTALVLVISLFQAINAHPQDFNRAESLQTFDLTGMTTDELRSALGEPDSRSGKESSEQWQYDSAKVFLAYGRVVAWTGTDVIAMRRDQHEVETTLQPEAVQKSGGFIGWKPEPAATQQNAIDDLLGLSVEPIETSDAPKSELHTIDPKNGNVTSLFRWVR